MYSLHTGFSLQGCEIASFPGLACTLLVVWYSRRKPSTFYHMICERVHCIVSLVGRTKPCNVVHNARISMEPALSIRWFLYEHSIMILANWKDPLNSWAAPYKLFNSHCIRVHELAWLKVCRVHDLMTTVLAEIPLYELATYMNKQQVTY